MTHPEEHLAGYVDATLSPHERRAVETHLADCARCRGEVTLAAGARAALGSLTEVPAPPDVAASALREAGAAKTRPANGPPAWYRIAGVAAAIAAGLLVVSLVLPKVGGSSKDAADRELADAGAADGGVISTPAGATALEIQEMNYDDASLSALSASYKAQEDQGGVTTAEAPEAALSATPAETQKALRCIVKSAPQETGQLTRLIKARFQGTPAYLAVFQEGPGADQPPDAVSVWVFATDGCAILSYSNARL
jgi:Putative zinc-finger